VSLVSSRERNDLAKEISVEVIFAGASRGACEVVVEYGRAAWLNGWERAGEAGAGGWIVELASFINVRAVVAQARSEQAGQRSASAYLIANFGITRTLPKSLNTTRTSGSS